MSQGSRTQRRAQSNTSGAGRAPGGSGGASHGPSGARRAGRRSTDRPPVVRRSFVERNRNAIIGLAAVVVVGVVAAFLFLGSTQAAYACESESTPAPSPSASAGAAVTGQPQSDMGRSHVDVGASVRYAYCPPASGSHYNSPPDGPIPARFYGKDESTVPEGWIHNLEHGGIVVLYRCASGDVCDTAQQQALQSLASSFPPSPVCKLPPGGNSPSPVVTRFDQMATPYMALVWGRILPLQTLDTSAILAFYQAEGERTNPEPQCATPNSSPGMTIPPSPSPS